MAPTTNGFTYLGLTLVPKQVEKVVTILMGPDPWEAGMHFMQYVIYKLSAIRRTNGYADAEWTTT